MKSVETKQRRKFGQHFTSKEIFLEYIIPEIKDILEKYIWVDLFAGAGNLILPILEFIPEEQKIEFFKEHIFLFDVQKSCVNEAIENAVSYGIPEEIAEKNILLNDSLRKFPKYLNNLKYPIFHVTNPPYLYLGYIVKHKETQPYLDMFEGINKGLQDLYQIALINDLRNYIKRMIYIIPSNFLFSNSGSNKIRDELLPYYFIKKGFIFEKKIFEHTGTNVVILVFERKKTQNNETQIFDGLKINEHIITKKYKLNPKYHYRAGSEFQEFISVNRDRNPLKSHYYLMQKEVDMNFGDEKVYLMDSNRFNGKKYECIQYGVNRTLKEKIQNNILWIRTVDTGSWEGRAGLYLINESFKTDGIIVSKNTYRTNPIQIFFDTPISREMQILLLKYFNLILEYLREKYDSEFMTTYKYSKASYTRKYFGLSQGKLIITTFPISKLNSIENISYFQELVENKQKEKIFDFIHKKYDSTNNQLKIPEIKIQRKGLDSWIK